MLPWPLRPRTGAAGRLSENPSGLMCILTSTGMKSWPVQFTSRRINFERANVLFAGYAVIRFGAALAILLSPLLVLLSGEAAFAQGQVAGGNVSSSGSGPFTYSLSFSDGPNATAPIGSIWCAWVPGGFFLPSTPTGASALSRGIRCNTWPTPPPTTSPQARRSRASALAPPSHRVNLRRRQTPTFLWPARAGYSRMRATPFPWSACPNLLPRSCSLSEPLVGRYSRLETNGKRRMLIRRGAKSAKSAVNSKDSSPRRGPTTDYTDHTDGKEVLNPRNPGNPRLILKALPGGIAALQAASGMCWPDTQADGLG